MLAALFAFVYVCLSPFMLVWQEYMLLFSSEEGLVTYGREK